MKPAPFNAKNIKLKEYLLWLGVTVMVTSIFWIAIEIYSAYSTSTVPDDISTLTTQLNPNLDQEVLENMLIRQAPELEFELQNNQSASPEAQTIQPSTAPLELP